MLLKFEQAFIRANQFAVGGLLLVMAVLVFANVVLRYLAGMSLPWVEEITRYMIVLIMLGLSLYSGLVLLRKIEKMRARMPAGIDHVSKGDPRRIEFNNLHRLSTTLMAFNLLLGFALAVMFALEE